MSKGRRMCDKCHVLLGGGAVALCDDCFYRFNPHIQRDPDNCCTHLGGSYWRTCDAHRV